MNRARILIVDDEEIACLSIEAIVQDLGVVKKAYTSKDAISIAKEFKPDLVLLDIHVDDADGFEIRKQLDVFLSDTSIIYITSSEDFASQAYENGGVDFITKPINLEMTHNRVKNQLEIAHSKRALHIANQRITTMLDSLDVGVLLTDNDGHIIDSNKKLASITGFTQQELHGAMADDVLFITDVGKDRNHELVKHALESEQSFKSFNKYHLKQRTDIRSEINVQVKVVHDNNDAISGTSVIINEIKTESESGKFLSERELIGRMRFLSEIVQKGSNIGDALRITCVLLNDVAQHKEIYGQEVTDCIKSEVTEKLLSIVSNDTVFGFLSDDRLVVAEPYKEVDGQSPSLPNINEMLDNFNVHYLGEVISVMTRCNAQFFPITDGTIDEIINATFDAL